MMRARSFSVLRSFALVLVAVQGLAFAFIPAVESRESAGGAPALERAHSSNCAIVHRPDTCLACQLLAPRTEPAPAAAGVPTGGVARVGLPVGHDSPAGNAGLTARPRTRAPPVSLG